MGASYEWLSDQKSHNDISDLSVFDKKFREDDLFSKNKYTGDYEKVEGRRGIYLDIPEENRFEFKAPVSSKYKLIQHNDIFNELNKAILANDDLSKDNIQVTDYAYDDYTKVQREILFLDHSENFGDTGIGQDDTSCLKIVALNSTDTSWKCQFFVGQFRDFCQNTMVFGGKRYFHRLLKHTSGFDYASEVKKVSTATGDFAEHGEHFRKMLDTPVTEEWVIKLFQETVAKKEVKLKSVNYSDNFQTAENLQKAIDENLSEEDKLKQNVNMKSFGALMARFQDELNHGMGLNLYTVYNALTNWSTHVGGDQDSYENDKGVIVNNTNKKSKLHNVRLQRQKEVVQVVNSPIWLEQVRAVA
jgi:hypothetical protein